MIDTIFEGTSEIQRLVIARHLWSAHPVVRSSDENASVSPALSRPR